MEAFRPLTPPRPFPTKRDPASHKNYTPSATKSQTYQPKTKTDAGSAAPALNQNNIPMPASDLYRVVGMLFIPPGDQIVAGLTIFSALTSSPRKAPSTHAWAGYGWQNNQLYHFFSSLVSH